MKVIMPIRGQDNWGSGGFGDSRSDKEGVKYTHPGVDYCCAPNSKVLAVKGGRVTKLGYTYGDDLSFRYVEVTDASGLRARYFYVEPSVEEGEIIYHGQILGHSQKLGERYPEITEHVHFEVIDGDNFIDPNMYYLRA